MYPTFTYAQIDLEMMFKRSMNIISSIIIYFLNSCGDRSGSFETLRRKMKF